MPRSRGRCIGGWVWVKHIPDRFLSLSLSLSHIHTHKQTHTHTQPHPYHSYTVFPAVGQNGNNGHFHQIRSSKPDVLYDICSIQIQEKVQSTTKRNAHTFCCCCCCCKTFTFTTTSRNETLIKETPQKKL